MLVKNYILKTMNAVSALAISAVLLESIFTTPSWAMEEEYWEDKSHFARLPAEVVTHIFEFLPLKSHDPVRLVSRTWQMLANDEKGAFGDFAALKKAYTDQIAQLLEQTPDLNLFSQTLSNLRKATTQLLERRSPEELKEFAAFLVSELQAKTSKHSDSSDEPIDSDKDLRKIWAPLALLRAFDKSWTHPIQEWIEARITQLNSEELTQDAFTLLGSTLVLRHKFQAPRLAEANEEERHPFAAELCERNRKSIQAVFDQGRTCRVKSDWKSAAKYFTHALEKDLNVSARDHAIAAYAYFKLQEWEKAAEYYTLALEKDPDSPARRYGDIAAAYFNFQEWPSAVKYYTVAIEKNSNQSADIFLNAGYAAAKAKQLEKAAVYFEKFIKDTDATSFNSKLYSDTLDLIESVLTHSNSEIPFREWISLVKSKKLETIPML
ncbi:MAG TPA: tetratricopeptide repeat protein [Alphaproteobacteria bacterium]|nr:tetratricopeptide repeat protein [Alphaproteobacteria bacterium]